MLTDQKQRTVLNGHCTVHMVNHARCTTVNQKMIQHTAAVTVQQCNTYNRDQNTVQKMYLRNSALKGNTAEWI